MAAELSAYGPLFCLCAVCVQSSAVRDTERTVDIHYHQQQSNPRYVIGGMALLADALGFSAKAVLVKTCEHYVVVHGVVPRNLPQEVYILGAVTAVFPP